MSILVLTSDTLIGTAAAGNIEYSSPIFTGTPISTERGIVPTQQYYRLNTAVVGANATGAQSLFGVGVTLSASTVYEFEINYVLAKTAGTTSHTTSIGFGGTATVNNILWQALGMVAATMPISTVVTGTANVVATNSTAAVQMAPAISTAGFINFAVIKGTVSINAGGTFIPQYTLSAAPGGAYTTQIGSYIRIAPVSASGSNTSVGAWA